MMGRPVSGRPQRWTPGEDATLLRCEGRTVEYAAKRLERYPGDIRRRARELGVHLIDHVVADSDGRSARYPNISGVDVARVLSSPFGQATQPGRAGQGVG